MDAGRKAVIRHFRDLEVYRRTFTAAMSRRNPTSSAIDLGVPTFLTLTFLPSYVLNFLPSFYGAFGLFELEVLFPCFFRKNLLS